MDSSNSSPSLTAHITLDNLGCPSYMNTKTHVEKHSREGRPFSAVHTTPFLDTFTNKLQLTYTIYLPAGLLQVQRSPNPSPHNHQVTQRGCHLHKNLIGPPQTSSGGETEYHATQSTTLQCRSGGEAEFQHPPDSQKGHAFKQPGWCSFPTSKRSNPETCPPKSACLHRPGYPCTATHSSPRRETPIHNGGSPPHRWCINRQQKSRSLPSSWLEHSATVWRLFVILHFSPIFRGFCRTQPPCWLCHVQKFFEVLYQIEGLCVVALQHLPYYGRPRSSVHVRMYSSNLPNTFCSVAEALAWASSNFFISSRRARASSSSFLSSRSCLRSLSMLCLSSSSCFSSFRWPPSRPA